MRRIIPAVLFAVTALALLTPLPALACPGCNGFLNSELGFGFNTSILFMMAMPFTVVGGVAVGIVMFCRKNLNTLTTPERELPITKEAGN